MIALKRPLCVAIQSAMYPPYDPPAAAIRVPSMNLYVAREKSIPFITSTYGLPPQSFVISSVNFCPYPVDPRRLIINVTYPPPENTCAFHRLPHAFDHIVCGPPCSR